jgi:addiction module HigA family antidote
VLNNRKRRPTHPGEVLREELLPETRLSQSELARRLGVSRGVVSNLVHERRAVTPDIAHRLARVFDTTPELWLNLQQAVDVWETYAANRSTYTKLKPFDDKQAA